MHRGPRRSVAALRVPGSMRFAPVADPSLGSALLALRRSLPATAGLLAPSARLPLRGHLRTLLPRLGQSDRDRLFPARHLSALPATTASQRSLLPLLHRSLDSFPSGFPVFAPTLLACRHLRSPRSMWLSMHASVCADLSRQRLPQPLRFQ